ncbi:MAG: DUF2189 domain-containing protein [Hyphomicrobiales bacterium]|nr:DUF2189 domain-containing protein [Hyphomicrobiales bacterium]
MSTFHVMAGGGERASAFPRIRQIRLSDVETALRQGWDDFLALRSELVIGALIYPVIGLVLAYWSSGANILHLLYPLAAGFALLGPFAAIGLYEISRRREAGVETTSWSALEVFKSPALPSIVALGLLLALAFLAWLGAAQILYQTLMGENAPASLSALVAEVTTTENGIWLIVLGNAIGFVFAALVFCATAIAFPLMIDRDVGLAVAVGSSFEAVWKNPGPMTAWALTIAIVLALGFAAGLIGLAVAMPVLGHATWRLYRALVPRAP